MTQVPGRTFTSRIADDLRSQIQKGIYPVGEAIPSSAQLSKKYGVSISTVRAAIGQLRADGILAGQPGKAVYVIATPAAVEQERITVEELARQVARLSDELRELADRVGVTTTPGKSLAAEVAELRASVEQLYARLGHPHPNIDSPALDQRRRAGA